MYRTCLTLFFLIYFFPFIIPITLKDFHSPCSDVFKYLNYSSIDRIWYGELTMLSETDLNVIRILITFDTPPQYFGTSYGSVFPKDEKIYSIVNLEEKLKAQVPKKIQFYVVHASLKLPSKLISIQLNSKQVCPKVQPTSVNKSYSKVVKESYLRSYTSKSSSGVSSQNYDVDGFNFMVTRPDKAVEAECFDVVVYDDKCKTSNKCDGILTMLSETNTNGSEGVWMRLIFDAPVELSSSYGNVTKIDDRTYVVQNVDDQLIGDRPKRVRFVFQYDSSKPAPNLLSFHHAGTQVCSAYFLQNSNETMEIESFSSQLPDLLDNDFFKSALKSFSRPNLFNDDFFGSKITSIFDEDSDSSKDNFTESEIKSISTEVPDSSEGDISKSEIKSVSTQVPDSSKDDISKSEIKSVSTEVSDSSEDEFFTSDIYQILKSRRNTTKPTGNDIISCGTVAIRPKPLITYGEETYEGEFPWHVALYYVKGVYLKYICGASLISKSFVITAAHCATKPRKTTTLNAENLIAYLGKHYLNENSNESVQDKRISEIIIHPQYNANNLFNDIALLKLALLAEYNNFVRPVCLWQDSINLSEILNKPGNVVGWGFDQTGNITEKLMQGLMPVVSLETCLDSLREFYSKYVTSKIYCAGFKNGTSVCNGNSGGGMVFPKSNSNPKYPTWQLRGLVSLSATLQGNGFKCDASNYVVFTDIAKYLDWIQNIIN